MSGKSNSSNNGSDSNLPDNTKRPTVMSKAELQAFMFHGRERKLFGGTSGEQDLGDCSVVQQKQEFSINSEEFPLLPGSEADPGIGNRNAVQGLRNASLSNLTTNIGSGNLSVQGPNQPSSSVLQQASPGIGNRNAVQGLSASQNLENATSGSNLATNRGPGNVSVQGKNQLSSSALQKGYSSGGPSSQSHVPTANSPNSKGCLDDYFPSADPPVPVQGLQVQQDPLQSESSPSHQQGQQQVLAVSTGGTSSSVNNQDLVRNTKGAGSPIPGVLHTSVSKDYRNAVVQGLGVSQNAGPQITSSATGGNISRSIRSDVQEQNQLASGVLQQGTSARGPISQSHVQAVNSPNPNDSFLPNLSSPRSPEGVRRHQEQPDSLQKGLEETSDVQQNQNNIQDENLRGFAGNADNSTNLSGKEKVQDNTFPTIPPQHTPMSRTVGYRSGESSSSHGQQTDAVSAAGSNHEQPRDRLLGYNLSDPLQRESSSSHQQGQQQVPAVSTGGTSSSVNSQDLFQNTNGAGGSIPGILPASAAMGNRSVIQGLENAGPQATISEGNISRSISSGGEQNQLMIGVLQEGSSAGGPISQSQFQAGNSPNSMGMLNDANFNDSFLPDSWQDEIFPGFSGNTANLRVIEKVQENTMPTMLPQHTPMSGTVGFSSGESSSSSHAQTNAVSTIEQQIYGVFDIVVRGLQQYNQEFRVEKLFETIYCSHGEEARVYAEHELYNRGWVYHEGLKSWLFKVPNVPLSEKTQTHEKGSYICFDPVSKSSIRKDDLVVEYNMLKERPALP